MLTRGGAVAAIAFGLKRIGIMPVKWPGQGRFCFSFWSLALQTVPDLKAQMTECQQAVLGVLAVEHVVLPVAVERPAAAPERVDEVEARLPQARNPPSSPPARAGRWRSKAGPGSAPRGSRRSPLPRGNASTAIPPAPLDRLAQLPQERRRGGGRRRQPHRQILLVAYPPSSAFNDARQARMPCGFGISARRSCSAEREKAVVNRPEAPPALAHIRRRGCGGPRSL